MEAFIKANLWSLDTFAVLTAMAVEIAAILCFVF